jgi:phosphohistidine phosphatase
MRRQERCVTAAKLKQNKQLVLLRHAKSSWDDPFLDDFDRPLSKRGRRAGNHLSAWLRKHDIRPDLVLCSPAVRTRETLALIAEAIGDKANIVHDKALYLAEADDLLAGIRKAEPDAASVMVIGHNPGLQDLAIALLPSSAKKSRAKLSEKFPTATVALFSIPIASWADLQPGEATLTKFVRPADLD